MLCLSLKTNCFIKNAFCRDLRRHRSHFGEEVARSFSTIPTSLPSQIPKNRWGQSEIKSQYGGFVLTGGGVSEIEALRDPQLHPPVLIIKL